MTTARPAWRPRRRGECVEVTRPCPYVACRYNLFLDVVDHATPQQRSQRVLLHGQDPLKADPAASCALDVAERGPQSATDIATLLHVTTARVSQIIDRANRRLRVVYEPAEPEPQR